MTYHFLIEETSYDRILSYAQNDSIDLMGFRFNYMVKNQYKYWFIPLFPIFLIGIVLVDVFLNSIVSSNLNFTGATISSLYVSVPYILNFSGIIIFVSFITFYYALIREGYEIPLNKSLWISIPLSGVLLFFPNIISLVTG